MANQNTQESLGQIPTQEQVQEVLTQLEYAPTAQFASTADVNSQARDRNHNKTGPTMDNGDNGMVVMKSKFDTKVQVYKFMHENKNPEGKKMSPAMRKKTFRELFELYSNLGLSTGPIANHLINDPAIQWSTFIEDERFWTLWDSKENMILEDQENMRRRKELRWGNQNRRDSEVARDRSRSRNGRNHNYNNRNVADNRNNMDKDSRDQVCPHGYTL